MTPSDLRPACTITTSLSISTTVPVTIEPGAISMVFRLSSNRSVKLSAMLFSYSILSLSFPVGPLRSPGWEVLE